MAADAEAPVSVNLVVDLFAVLVFAASQTAFWWFVGGPAAADAPRVRARILQEARQVLLRRNQPFLASQLDGSVRAVHDLSRDAAERDRAAADAHNRHQVLVWLVPVLGVLLVLLVACVAYNWRTQRALTLGHWVGLVLVLFCYVPELVFHATVVHEYSPIGDARVTRLLVGEDVTDADGDDHAA
jgi:hypothetical protein